MVLKTRIIPVLQFDGIQAVKTTRFQRPPRPVGSLMQHVINMQRRDIDELVILDINATKEKREPAYDKVEQYARELYCPLTVGGGISEIGHIKNLLNAGADKVIIKTATGLIPEAVQKYGAQCIVLAIDCCWCREHVDLCTEITDCQPGEVLITAIDKDGTRTGYDLSSIEFAIDTWTCPIVANGGCGSPQHMLEALQAGASAVAASSIFLFTEMTPKMCARYLDDYGVNVRL